jgi:peptidoglycan lytic transglycosylase
MRRFRRRRRRLAAAALLPVAATMSTAGLVAAAPGLAQEVPDDGTPDGESPPVDDGRTPTKTKIDANQDVLAGNSVRISGTVKPAVDDQQVVVHVPGQDEVAKTGPGGKFSVSWTPNGPGEYKVQASAQGTETTTGSESKSLEVTAYRKAEASWYGPGLYGNPTACGGSLTPTTLGVANKSLPCGTKLTLRYHGKSVEVEVIDRGPYSGNREFDLTAAVKQKLGFPSTGTVLASK